MEQKHTAGSRRGVGRSPARNAYHYTIGEREISDEAAEFGKAMQQYMKDHRRPYPTWSEVLAVALSLGYRR